MKTQKNEIKDKVAELNEKTAKAKNESKGGKPTAKSANEANPDKAVPAIDGKVNYDQQPETVKPNMAGVEQRGEDAESASVFSTTPMWHKLGKQVDGALTSEQAIKLGGMDYTVEKRLIQQPDGGVFPEWFPKRYCNYRTDNNEPLGIVGEQYQVIQNAEAFDFFDNIVEKGKAMYESGGVLGHGERIWIMAKLKNVVNLGTSGKNADKVEMFVLLTTTHDNSAAMTASLTPVRVVCQNTLSYALKASVDTFKIRHTKGYEEKIKQSISLFKFFQDEIQNFAERSKELVAKQITHKMKEQFMNHFFPLTKKKDENGKPYFELSGQMKNKREEFEDILKNAPGQQTKSAVGTAWGLYNAFTYMTDHVMNGTSEEGKLYRMWYGNTKKQKAEAFNFLLNQKVTA